MIHFNEKHWIHHGGTESTEKNLITNGQDVPFEHAMSIGFRVLYAVYFFLTAATLAMFLGLAAPGEIFFGSAIILCGAAFLWPFTSGLAAGISLPLVIGLTFMLFRYPFGSFRFLYGSAFAGCYVLIAVAFRYSTNRRVLVPLSVVLSLDLVPPLLATSVRLIPSVVS